MTGEVIFSTILNSMNREQKEAEQLFLNKTIVKVWWQNGSLSLFTHDGDEIFVTPGIRGLTEYDGDSITFYSLRKKKVKNVG